LTSTAETDSRVAAVGQHLALGGVVVVGAGISISARFPMTVGLNTLLWDALDADAPARAEMAAALGRPDQPAKQLVGDTWETAQLAWKAVSGSVAALGRFQYQFSRLDTERSSRPSPGHEALARLIHAGIVECVVSLNWDTALEQAYRRLYGVPLPPGVLFKPHGDAARPKTPWTLPHESGLIPLELKEAMDRLADAHARTLLIIGYSERDRTVVEDLIGPVDETWRTVRVGPTAAGAGDLQMSAEDALPLLAGEYAKQEDKAAWHTVTYQGSRDIRAALRGERLSPSDVDACPRLAEVDLLVRALRADHAVVVNGPTGTGKSISAYQALRELADAGFETLRLRDDARTRGLSSWLDDLRWFPRPKVLLVDDAQDLPPDTVRELTEHADADTLILVVGVDHIAGGVRTLRLGAKAAVSRLAEWVRDERTTLFPLISDLDDQVGSYPRDIHFDRRIDVAENEDGAWQFFYTLTGGWRRMRRDAIELRDVARADLALMAIAAAQIAGVDAGVDRTTLAGLAAEMGRGSAWIDSSLEELKTRRLVLESDGRFRCAHLQSAYAVLSWMLHPIPWNSPASARPGVPPIASAVAPAPRPPTVTPTSVGSASRVDLPDAEVKADREVTCKLIAFLLDSPTTPLRGLSWLAGRGVLGNERSVLRWQQVLGPERDAKLAERALATPATGDVAAAAQLLADTLAYSDDSSLINKLKAYEPRVREWYANIAPENAWALGDLVNSLQRPDEEYAREVASYAHPERLALLVLDGGWPHTYSTGHALDRLCNTGGPEVRAAISPHLNHESYQQMFKNGDPEFWRAVSLIADLVSVDYKLATNLLEGSADRLARQFGADPVRLWNDMTSLVIRLGYGPRFLRGSRRPPTEVTRALKAFVGALDRQRIADTIAGPADQWGQLNFESFVYFLSEVGLPVFNDVVDRVDMGRFEASVRTTPQQSQKTAFAVAALLHARRRAEVHAILDRLEPVMDELDPYVAWIAPDIASRALRRGLPLDLGLDQQHWDAAAEVLNSLHKHDPTIAAEVAASNAERMAIGLAATNFHNPWEGLRHWTAVCDEVVPGLLDKVIARLPEGAVSGWDRGLRRPEKHHTSRRRDIAPLVRRAVRLGGHVQLEATALLRRFPAAARRA